MRSPLKFKFINLSDPYYQHAKMLRWEILEKPMGMPPSRQPSDPEKGSIQLIALVKDRVVGCILCHPQSPTEGKLFDFALSEEGKGFGRKMVSKLEEYVKRQGFSHLYVMAKEDHLPLFSGLGYSPEGDSFEEYGVLYTKMGKSLLPAA